METIASIFRWLAAGTLALGAALPLRSQVAFLGEGTLQGYVVPRSADSVASKGELVPSSPTPLGLTGTETLTGDDIASSGIASGTYGVIATFGGLSGITSANANYPATSPNAALYSLGLGARHISGAISSITVSDLIFDGPGATVSTRLNFLYSSAGTTTITPNPVGKGFSQWSVSLAIGMPSVSGTVAFNGSIVETSSLIKGVPGVSDFAGKFTNPTELLADYTSGTTTVHTPFVEVPTGVPLTLSIRLDVNSNVTLEYGALGNAGVTANVGFPGGGLLSGGGSDVFDLPAGYTVKSDSWNLRANALGGSGGGGAVPEPQEYAVAVAIGLLGFAGWQRHLSRSSPTR